jgi:steroid 5-alpha reductase family enzyme
MSDTPQKSPGNRGLIGILICLVLGGLVVLAGSDSGLRLDTGLGPLPLFVLCGMVGFVLHWLIFVPSFLWQTEHYFDLTGALSFIGTILLANWLAGATAGDDLRSLLLSGMVLAWSLRLGSFLFLRVKRAGQDRRFNELKTRFWRFLFTWTLGGLWVLITVAPVLAAITSGRAVSMDGLAWAGVALWLAGFVLEVVADRQKTEFRRDPANAEHFISTGLWAWSRHPNYLGEMVLWVGAALVALPALQGWQYATLLSPVFVILLISRISGIPMLEERADQKWGDDPAYQAYKKATPVLVPGVKGR